MRASLMRVIIDPTVGEDADVPNTSSNSVETAISRRWKQIKNITNLHQLYKYTKF